MYTIGMPCWFNDNGHMGLGILVDCVTEQTADGPVDYFLVDNNGTLMPTEWVVTLDAEDDL